MDASWLIATGTLIGLGAYAYSVTKPDSPDESGESTTELQNSDRPSFSSLSRTNPERYIGWKDCVNAFGTSCGWTPDEEYCPSSVVADADCNSIVGHDGENCTRVFYQLNDTMKAQVFNPNKRRWSSWSEDNSGCKWDFSFGESLCVINENEIINVRGCDPIRVRAKYPETITDGNFDVELALQLLGLVDVFTSCHPNAPIYMWTSEESMGLPRAIKIDAVSLRGGRSGTRTLAEFKVDNSVDPPQDTFLNVNNWSTRQEITYGTEDYEFECWTGFDGWEDKSGTYDLTYTRQRFTVNVDNSDGYYNGTYDLEVQINIGRENDSWLPEWTKGCEFNETVTVTIPNYVVVYSPELCEGCKDGKVLMDYMCGKDVQDCNIRAKYNYTELKGGVGGYLTAVSAYSEAPNSAKCMNHGGLTCTSESASESISTTRNAETLFPRNGYMIW